MLKQKLVALTAVVCGLVFLIAGVVIWQASASGQGEDAPPSALPSAPASPSSPPLVSPSFFFARRLFACGVYLGYTFFALSTLAKLHVGISVREGS